MRTCYVGLFLVATVFVMAGCQSQTTRWSGVWVDERAEDHGGDLHCVAREIDESTWKAKFSGFCGRNFAYDIQMDGRREGDEVVFAGDIDLGEEDGGVYSWTGSMAGDRFDGHYATKEGKAGTFQMTRRE